MKQVSASLSQTFDYVRKAQPYLSDERHSSSRALLQSMGGIMRGMIHKMHGAFGAMNQLVARRGQGVGQAVVPRTRCGCGRLIGSLRGLGRAAERRRAHRRWLRRAAEARGRVVARVAEVRRGAARRRHLLLPVFRLGWSSTETDGAASAGQPRVCMCSRTARARPGRHCN